MNSFHYLSKRPREFDLQVLPGLAAADAIVLGKALKQLDVLPQHVVLSRTIRALQRLFW
jgi:hypothetical protein